MTRWFTVTMVCVVACSTLVLKDKGVSYAGEAKEEKWPFYPSLLNTSDGRPVTSADFIPPEDCKQCHETIYNQWKGSMHSNAYVDPVFQAMWKLGSKETGGAIDKLCAGCHTAIGVMSGEMTNAADESKLSSIARQGVQCDLCHSVESLSHSQTPTGEPQNASLVVAPGEVKRGPYKDAETPFHKTAYSEIHTKAELCASCHHVYHPVSNFPIERTYDEWKFSVYAQHGIQCQDCHMMPVELAIKTARTLEKQKNPGRAAEDGPMREHVYTHEFVGGNFTIPALLGSDKHADLARQRLQGAAEMEIIAPPAPVSAGKIARLKVKVTNVAAGHNLPTSLTEVRQMWLDVSVTDAGGNEIFRSGSLDEEGNIDPEAVIFRAVAVDKDGHHTVKPWEIVRFESNNTIPPKGSAVEKYSFQVPEEIEGTLKVKAVLRYRSYPQAVANLLLGKDVPVLPIVDMVTAETVLRTEELQEELD